MPGSLTNGKSLYESNCMGCHGALGGGKPVLNLGKTVFVKTGVNYSLKDYIDLFMPKGNPGACKGQCAVDIAAYISNSFSDTYPVVTKTGFSLQLIDNCGQMEIPTEKSTVIFDNNVNNITGWNHSSPGFSAPFDKLNLTGEMDRLLYNVPGVTLPDSNCTSLKTQSLVLIKKYANWDKQHV